MIEAISKLHPAAQVAAILGITACICTGIYCTFEFFKKVID